jgi:hypothetical protein
VAANYWSALFRSDRDGRTAGDGGLLFWGPSCCYAMSVLNILIALRSIRVVLGANPAPVDFVRDWL